VWENLIYSRHHTSGTFAECKEFGWWDARGMMLDTLEMDGYLTSRVLNDGVFGHNNAGCLAFLDAGLSACQLAC
jgi:hypothetical protein